MGRTTRDHERVTLPHGSALPVDPGLAFAVKHMHHFAAVWVAMRGPLWVRSHAHDTNADVKILRFLERIRRRAPGPLDEPQFIEGTEKRSVSH